MLPGSLMPCTFVMIADCYFDYHEMRGLLKLWKREKSIIMHCLVWERKLEEKNIKEIKVEGKKDDVRWFFGCLI